MGFFTKIKEGLKKTKVAFTEKIETVVNSFTKIDEDFFEELEEILISSDVGVETSEKICNLLRTEIKKTGITEPEDIKNTLKEIITKILEENLEESNLNLETKPSVILIVGVNGVGKTTSIGKLANFLKSNGKSVLISAADTFRAAATEQLEEWANRSKSLIVKQNQGADPGAVVFDSISAAKSKSIDIIICDTAGRLHNKKDLMAELEKIGKIINRELPNCSKEILLVLDASTGQNGLNQAIEFKKALGLTGVILTKLDGTAKGGIVLSIKEKLGIPIKFIGTGEKIEDLQTFNAKDFAEELF